MNDIISAVSNKIDIVGIEELCDILKISPTIAYQLVKSKKVKAFKMGNKWKINKDSIYEYISNQCNK